MSVQRWGEYYTVITEVTLRKDDGGLIWRAVALPDKEPKLHYLKLCAGKNDATPGIWGDTDAYHYEVAGGTESFELQPGVTYVIEVRGPGFLRRSHRSFTLW